LTDSKKDRLRVKKVTSTGGRSNKATASSWLAVNQKHWGRIASELSVRRLGLNRGAIQFHRTATQCNIGSTLTALTDQKSEVSLLAGTWCTRQPWHAPSPSWLGHWSDDWESPWNRGT
jgi:hypothetical protein